MHSLFTHTVCAWRNVSRYSLGILCAAMCVAMIPQSASAAAPKACSSRYPTVQEYPITPSGTMGDWKSALQHWGITRQWGLKDNATFVYDKELRSKDIGMQVIFPKGSINPSSKTTPRGGVGFYATQGFPANATAACLRYRVYVPKDFSFAKGGKLPGLYGGKPPSGCKSMAELFGFSARYMWREDGLGTLYMYAPGKSRKCGELIGKGSWKFTAGKWHTLEQEIVLNTPAKENGIIRVWVDGKNVINQTNATLRVSRFIFIDGIMFNTFFGGNDASWASPKDQHLLFEKVQTFFR